MIIQTDIFDFLFSSTSGYLKLVKAKLTRILIFKETIHTDNLNLHFDSQAPVDYLIGWVQSTLAF